jgi:hypothetical protein
MRRACLTGLAPAVLIGLAVAPAADAASCGKPVFRDPNTVVTCKAVGVEQSFTVPPGVRRVRVIATGAGGGNGSDVVTCSGFIPTPPCTSVYPGGHGGVATIASADLRVSPGRKLYVDVGGIGGTQQGPPAGAGGFNGGASGGALTRGNGFSNYLSGGGGGGGGASDVRTCSSSRRSCNTLASRLIVAAGGGGGGGAVSFTQFPGDGGFGGGVLGVSADGANADGGAGAIGGGGATHTAGGAAGSTGAAPGVRGTGGSGAGVGDVSREGGGGGGGGGVFGGGGGSAGIASDNFYAGGAGGGGGSSFGPRGTRFSQAATLEPGLVRFVYLRAR